MKRYFLSLIVLLVLSATLWAQVQNKCGTMHAYESAVAKNPSIILKDIAIEDAIKNAIPALPSKKTRGVIYTIPVVIHIIHNGEPIGTDINISDAQAISQINDLNEDFRLLNADSLPTSHPFWGNTADCEIQFCLAKQDPQGKPTTGITRHQGNLAGWERQDIEDIIKPATIWNRHKYLNIWCVNFGGVDATLLGYATFPSTATDSTDGIVIRPQAFGDQGLAGTGIFTGNDYGRTGTHEVGHWLNLRHIWGDAVCGDDFVNDTEIAEASNYACPTFPSKPFNSCGSSGNGEMYMNYMDYVDDKCMVMFTAGQVARMRAALTTNRASLLSSPGCNWPTNVVNHQKLDEFAIYPNPSNSILYISKPNTIINSIEIYTITGVSILNNFTQKEYADRIALDVNSLPNGNYILKIQSENQVSSLKFTILK
jgi:hypothetical protein